MKANAAMRMTVQAATLISTIALISCSRPAAETAGPHITGPVIIEMNPSGRVALAGVATFTTSEPVRAIVTVSDDAGHSFTATSNEEPASDHEIVLLGFRPNREHHLDVTLETGNGTVIPAASVSMLPPGLPDAAAPVNVTVHETGAIEPGYTLVPMFRWINRDIDQTYGQMIIIDADGEIVWLYEAPHSFVDVKQMDNGHLIYLQFNRAITEIDMLGNVVNEWHAAATGKVASVDSTAVDLDTFHHEMLVMPSGNFLALSTEVREVADWYTSEQDPDAPRETQNIISDVLVEFQPDGTIVNQWRFFDLIDPYNIGYGSLSTGFYSYFYQNILEEPAPDWTHDNGIFFDEATNTALVSSNHLSTVMNLDLTSGELIWMLGDPKNWREPWRDLLLTPEDPEMGWSYHHHAPKWTPAGTLLLFDNGAVRAQPFDPPLSAENAYSRAVEYEIDAANQSVREVWSYGGPGADDERFLSAYISEADWLPETGNILVTKGGRVRDRDGTVLMFPEEGHNWITLTEVTHTTPAEKVWEAVIEDRRWGMAAFRSDRIPSLYW